MKLQIAFSLITSLFITSAFASLETRTPIKHVVVIFQENRSFDSYFGTYPFAENKHGETPFHAKKNTPDVNGLSKPLRLINKNQVQPFRIPPSGASNTCNPDHKYTTLQKACDSGLMDNFVETTGLACVPPTMVMGYYDGNTVTALWNYAQHFAMSDNFHTTTIAASTVGAVNLISGQTHGAIPDTLVEGSTPIVVQGTLINDIDPTYDDCSKTADTVALTGINIGNLLNKKHITWGWFQGGFSDCTSAHVGPANAVVIDYVPHHNPFQYYASTSNPKHLPPSSPSKIGKTDQANHLYDLSDFWTAIKHGNMPSVSFLKAAAYQNGHGGNSDPFLEQEFLVKTINKLQKLPQWKNMAIIIAYDDSGGWYDHEMPPIVNQSQTFADALVAPGSAGTETPLGGYQGRPGYGFRVPFLLISPWAKSNFVDNTLTDQTSILSFIEYNWKLGRIGDFSFDKYAAPLSNMFDFSERKNRRLILHRKTGSVVYFQTRS